LVLRGFPAFFIRLLLLAVAMPVSPGLISTGFLSQEIGSSYHGSTDYRPASELAFLVRRGENVDEPG
jgi:hypothetical protein